MNRVRLAGSERSKDVDRTLSIWMYATDRYRYAVLLRMRDALKRRPIGRMLRRNTSFDMLTSFTPSRRCVVFPSTRVPMACQDLQV